jgi:hypothetical protein
MKKYRVFTYQLDPYSSAEGCEECEDGEWYSVEEVDTVIERLRSALAPFSHPDLSAILGGTKDSTSIVFQRNCAILRIGDFEKAAAALADKERTSENNS